MFSKHSHEATNAITLTMGDEGPFHFIRVGNHSTISDPHEVPGHFRGVKPLCVDAGILLIPQVEKMIGDSEDGKIFFWDPGSS